MCTFVYVNALHTLKMSQPLRKNLRSTTSSPSPSSSSSIATTPARAKKNRGPQLCSICHYLRAGREVVLSNGQKIRRSHEVDCKIYGPCTNINCGHPTGHRDVLMAQKQQIKAAKAATLKRKQDNLAAIAGIKPDGGYEFDQVLQQTLQEAGFNR